MNILAFLHRNCKPLMTRYYKWRYKNEIYKVLSLYAEHEETGIKLSEAAKILTLDEDNWSMKKSIRMLGVCIYLGFMG